MQTAMKVVFVLDNLNFYLIFHLIINFCRDFLHFLHLCKNIVNALIDIIFRAEDSSHAGKNVAEFLFKGQQFAKTLF